MSRQAYSTVPVHRPLNGDADATKAGDGPGPSAVSPIVHEVLGSSGQPFGGASRAFMERGFGHDFSHVRIHTDARAAESARAMDALAYTVGHDIVFGHEQYAPATPEGTRLLAHELTHTIQQGNIHAPQRTLTMSDHSHPAEREADAAAAVGPARGAFTVRQAAQPAIVQRQAFRLTPPTLLEPRSRRISLFSPGQEPHLQLNLPDTVRDDLLTLRGVRGVRVAPGGLPSIPPPQPQPPPTPSLPPLQLPAPTPGSSQPLDEPNKIWELDFNFDIEPLSQMGQFLMRWGLPLETPGAAAVQRTSQILAVLSGQNVEDTPPGLRLLNAGVNVLTTQGPASTLLQRLHLRDVTVVFNPSSRTYGLSVQFKLP